MNHSGNDDIVGATPEETKQNLVKELHADFNSQQDVFGVAANMFGVYLPRFKGKIQALNAKAVARVLFALIEVPINMKEFKPVTKEEKEAFLIGQSLLEAKMMMILHTLHLNEKTKASEEPVLKQEEVTNVGTE